MTKRNFLWCFNLLVAICMIFPVAANAAAKKKSSAKAASKPAAPLVSSSPLLQSLEKAVEACQVSKVQQILAEKPPVNARVSNGMMMSQLYPNSPVLWSSINAYQGRHNWPNARDCVDTFAALVRSGADLWTLDNTNNAIVASLDSFNLLKAVGKNAVDLKRKSARGNTPLSQMIIVNGKRLEEIMAKAAAEGERGLRAEEQDFLQLASYYMAQSDVNAANTNKSTAVMFAAVNGYTNIVWSLAKSGADFKLKDKDGKTTLDYARASGNIDTITMVRKAMAGELDEPPLFRYEEKWWM